MAETRSRSYLWRMCRWRKAVSQIFRLHKVQFWKRNFKENLIGFDKRKQKMTFFFLWKKRERVPALTGEGNHQWKFNSFHSKRFSTLISCFATKCSVSLAACRHQTDRQRLKGSIWRSSKQKVYGSHLTSVRLSVFDMFTGALLSWSSNSQSAATSKKSHLSPRAASLRRDRCTDRQGAGREEEIHSSSDSKGCVCCTSGEVGGGLILVSFFF